MDSGIAAPLLVGGMFFMMLGGLILCLSRIKDPRKVYADSLDRVIQVEEGPGYRDKILTVLRKDGSEVRFCGSFTVWHCYPSGNRAGTYVEGRLSELMKGVEFEKYEAIKNDRAKKSEGSDCCSE